MTRYQPTTNGADYIRTVLASAGIKARVAKQRFAYRVVTDQGERAASLLTLSGFSNPLGGDIYSDPRQLFVYDFQNMGA